MIWRLQEKRGALFFPVSTCILALSVPFSLSPPKFLHNNWTWRQGPEYEIREQDEEPKAEDGKRIRTKIRWRVGETEKEKIPALSDRSRVDRMLVYSVSQISIALQQRSHLISSLETAAEVTATFYISLKY